MSKRSSRTTLRQRAITNAHTTNIAVSPRPTSSGTPTAPVWFELQLARKNSPSEELIEITTDEDYTLTLTAKATASTFHHEEYRQGIPISSTIDLRLQCISCNTFFLSENISLTAEEIQHLHTTYTFHIPEVVHSKTLQFQLHFKLPYADMQILGSSTLAVPQGYIPIEQPFFDTYYLVSDLPQETAILIVKPHPEQMHDQGMVISGRNAYQNLSEETYIANTIVNIAKLMRINKEDATSIRGLVREFSYDLPHSLKQWLTTLQKKYQEKFELIIIDQSKLETPWELIELEALTHTYIGVIARVTRWPSHQKLRRTPLDSHPIIHQGSVMYYLDTKSNGIHFYKEQQALDDIQNIECQTLEHLEDHLSESLEKVGLIYVGCHGQEGRSLQEQQGMLKASHLSAMEIHTETRPIAFFNACGSGRIVRGDLYDNSSFVHTMLSHFAQGYIGTLADVGGQEASELAGRFLQMCGEDNDKSITEILRDLRRQMVKELYKNISLPRHIREAIEKKFLYTFMYVYYGNPQARLRLTPRTAVIATRQHVEETSCNNN